MDIDLIVKILISNKKLYLNKEISLLEEKYNYNSNLIHLYTHLKRFDPLFILRIVTQRNISSHLEFIRFSIINGAIIPNLLFVQDEKKKKLYYSIRNLLMKIDVFFNVYEYGYQNDEMKCNFDLYNYIKEIDKFQETLNGDYLSYENYIKYLKYIRQLIKQYIDILKNMTNILSAIAQPEQYNNLVDEINEYEIFISTVSEAINVLEKICIKEQNTCLRKKILKKIISEKTKIEKNEQISEVIWYMLYGNLDCGENNQSNME